ncbi:MAG: hypothetical protein ACREPV_02650 [Lysobacter sp.]
MRQDLANDSVPVLPRRFQDLACRGSSVTVDVERLRAPYRQIAIAPFRKRKRPVDPLP